MSCETRSDSYTYKYNVCMYNLLTYNDLYEYYIYRYMYITSFFKKKPLK